MSTFSLTDGNLKTDSITLLEDVPEAVAIVADPHGCGVFLRYDGDEAAHRHVVDLGIPCELSRYAGSCRVDPWWMEPTVGSDMAALPVETQYLYLQRTDGRYVLILPLLDGWFRCALQGSDYGHLAVVADTGDGDTVGRTLTVAFVAVDTDPYRLMAAAAKSVMAHMHTGRLRSQKPVPPIIDYFGWCTWDAFYGDVSHDLTRQGLESFRAAGVEPRYLILDDGWQSVADVQTDKGKSRRLSALCANDKFPGDLSTTVQMAKNEFKIQQFYVWHAVVGYWDGVDTPSLPEYRAVVQDKHWSSEIIALMGENTHGESEMSLVPPESIDRFYNDYHRHLMLQGVDGVKVDSQSVLEAVGEGHGGRVELMQTYHEALEGSVHIHFLGSLINCMSCSNDMIYSALNSNLTRSSTDFWPKRPETHGMHVWANAVNSLWMGEFIHPDWDMFQSGHQYGAFHAAARAISGGPVYVSDKPGSHNADVLRALVFSDGTVARCQQIGRPTLDSLFANPRVEGVPFKVFNHNRFGGVIGAFNISQPSDDDAAAPTAAGSLSPADVYGLEGDQFAVYLHDAGSLHLLGRDDTLALELGPLTFEIATIAPIHDGVALIGPVDKYNSGGAIDELHKVGPRSWHASLRDGGPIIAFSRQAPKAAFVNGVGHTFHYEVATGALRLDIPVGKAVELSLTYGAAGE